MYYVDDNVLVTCKLLRKNPTTGIPETLTLTDEVGVIKKASTFEEKPEKNQYHVETTYGVCWVNEVKLQAVP